MESFVRVVAKYYCTFQTFYLESTIESEGRNVRKQVSQPQELTSSDHARLTARAGELRDQVGELRAAIRQILGEGHPATGKADDIDGCFQRLQWALDRAHANRDGQSQGRGGARRVSAGDSGSRTAR